MEEVPCYRMEELTEEQVDKLRLLDNKLNESDWDLDLLFEDVPDLDFSDFDLDWDFEEEETKEVTIKEKELKPYKKVHYLITLDINDNDKVIDKIAEIREMEGIEVDSTLN